MAKPPLRTVSLDTYAIVIDGETYHPHEGESVQVYPTLSAHERNVLTSLARDRSTTAGWYGGAMSVLSGVLVSWNVTDREGKVLPAPDSGSLSRLDATLIDWLFDQFAPKVEDA